MPVDFNELVANVASKSARAERAAGLVNEAQAAHADAVAELAAAEAELQRAIAVECGMLPQQQRITTEPTALVIPMTPTPVRRHRCSLCRRPGHKIQKCPDVVGYVGAAR